MIGLDTTVLLAHEVRESPLHERVREHISELISTGDARFGISPQVVHEFLHVVTDPRRFEKPLNMEDALERAMLWWNAQETVRCETSERSMALFADWMQNYKLGRKRILDTALAASYHSHGINRLATANTDDFAVFGVFTFEDWARF